MTFSLLQILNSNLIFLLNFLTSLPGTAVHVVSSCKLEESCQEICKYRKTEKWSKSVMKYPLSWTDLGYFAMTYGQVSAKERLLSVMQLRANGQREASHPCWWMAARTGFKHFQPKVRISRRNDFPPVRLVRPAVQIR